MERMKELMIKKGGYNPDSLEVRRLYMESISGIHEVYIMLFANE